MTCEARQYSDMAVCKACNLAWDMNDGSPPRCRSPRLLGFLNIDLLQRELQKVAKHNRTPQAQRAAVIAERARTAATVARNTRDRRTSDVWARLANRMAITGLKLLRIPTPPPSRITTLDSTISAESSVPDTFP